MVLLSQVCLHSNITDFNLKRFITLFFSFCYFLLFKKVYVELNLEVSRYSPGKIPE